MDTGLESKTTLLELTLPHLLGPGGQDLLLLLQETLQSFHALTQAFVTLSYCTCHNCGDA